MLSITQPRKSKAILKDVFKKTTFKDGQKSVKGFVVHNALLRLLVTGVEEVHRERFNRLVVLNKWLKHESKRQGLLDSIVKVGKEYPAEFSAFAKKRLNKVL